MRVREFHCIGLILSVFLLSISACQTPETDSCDNRVCPLGSVCTPNGDSCVPPDQIAGCKGLVDNDRCSYAGEPDGICLDRVCYPQAACGNGVVETELGEVCDEGAQNSDEPDAACRATCLLPSCGDNVIDVAAGENCDDGNVFPGDGCSVFCASEVCGNGLIDLKAVEGGFLPAEECDDGANSLNHDGCTPSCESEEPRWRTANASTPSGRTNHIIAYDAARGRVLLFGGFGDFGNESDTWEWDGTSWTQRFPNNSPTFKENDVMTYDAARGRVLLFADATSDVVPGGTWEWDGTNWTKMSPSVSPTVESPAISYDAARARVVLFGIDDAAGVETWEWDGLEWDQQFPTESPSYRFDHAMAYDPIRGQVVLFGGFGIDGLADFDHLGDTWEWDGTVWQEVAPAGAAPIEREDHAMAFDASRGRVTLYGGRGRAGSPARLADIWEWNGTAWTERFPAGSEPAGRNQHAMAYDAARKRLVLFGGEVLGPSGSIGDTWEWDGDNWAEQLQSASPPARDQHALAYDSEQGETLLFGGLGIGASTYLGDTWAWTGIEWQERAVFPSPAPRRQHKMVYDSLRQRTVLFGGSSPGIQRSDTWEWDGAEWLAISVVNRPGARSQHAIAFDAARGRVVLFGGRVGVSETIGDTWEWDGTDWVQASPTNSPTARLGHGMAYDAVRERIVLFGGVDATGPRDDTWEWDGVDWSKITPNTSPAGREEHTMAYDATRGRVLLFGGSRNAGLRLNDTWEWDGTDWARTFLSTASPSVRSEHAMAYDGARGRGLLFGGRDDANRILGDTWTFQYTAGANESCTTQFDGDGDGLIGCDDPDCWGRCTPSCPPGASCDSDAPSCGDGVCNSFLENRRLCPQDCGAPAVLCGNFYCDLNENAQICLGDCPP